MKERKNLTKRLVESSLMIALGTVLSMLKLVEMPYGGSITLASMLPIVIVAYRHGVAMGLGSGLVYAVIQQLLGLNTLSYFTTWQSVVAIIFLDYIIAFTVVGLGGIFKGKLAAATLDVGGKQTVELCTGMAFVCILRYICHTVSGATVWAGLSIPTEAALIYSIGYNATYMLPETIIGVAVTAWLGGILDLTRSVPTRLAPRAETSDFAGWYSFLPHVSALAAVIGVIADVLLIFPYLQDPESGEFTFTYLSSVSWVAVGIISAVCIAVSAACAILFAVKKKSTER